jgi:beta-lactamase regulating signal transducer with metallopeptidase domain/HEAT repeat protein
MGSANEFVLSFLLNSTWQIAVIFILAALGTWFLKNSAAHCRYVVWVSALALCLIAPAITAIDAWPSLSTPAKTITVQANSTDSTDDNIVIDHTRRRSSHVVVSTTPRNMQLIAVAYAVFLGLCALRFVRLWATKERLRRSVSFAGLTTPMEIALNRCRAVFEVQNVELARSLTARVPYTLGITRPLIVLPDSFCGDIDQETLLSVIGHEMAHVRRRDFLAKLVCELVSLPLSFHPLTFLIKRQIERERELACDELVTRQVLRPESYARSLLRAADLSLLPARSSIMLSVFDGRMLEERIRQLMHKRLSSSKWSARAIMIGVIAALCLSSLLGSAFGFSLRVPITTPIASPSAAVATTAPPQEPTTDRAKQTRLPVASQLDSTSPQELARAACDAGKNQDLQAIPTLVAMLADDRKTEPLVCWNTGRWSPALDTFKHPSPGEQAALALASMGPAAFRALTNELNNPSATTRRNAAWAIGELTNMPPGERAPAIPQLITLLGDTDAWVRMAAARAIGEVRDGRATETLIATLADADWRVRRLAAWALNEMKEKRAVSALCQLLLGDSRAEVRSAAAEALGEIASAEALPSLQRALNDPELAVRAKATWAISEIEDN